MKISQWNLCANKAFPEEKIHLRFTISDVWFVYSLCIYTYQVIYKCLLKVVTSGESVWRPVQASGIGGVGHISLPFASYFLAPFKVCCSVGLGLNHNHVSIITPAPSDELESSFHGIFCQIPFGTKCWCFLKHLRQHFGNLNQTNFELQGFCKKITFN